MNKKNPRILIVTPEITYLPKGMGSSLDNVGAKTGGLADVSATLVSALLEKGADVHVAVPDYKRIFKQEHKIIRDRWPNDRVHFAEDRAFFYQNTVYPQSNIEKIDNALIFQRELINNIIPQVKPDLIHCNDWTTGFIPAVSKQLGIPCLFSIHNVFTFSTTMAHMEYKGIDAASFWNNLYFLDYPSSYENAREKHQVDFLTSGVFAASFINTVGPTFLREIANGIHSFIPPHIQREIANKLYAGYAVGILNSPDPSFDPKKDEYLESKYRYDVSNFEEGKKLNKQFIQSKFGLNKDTNAPLFFWPSRLDDVQKGCELFSHILFDVTYKYGNLQVIIVADGPYQEYFRGIVDRHNLHNRVVVNRFEEELTRYAYAASDFILMPSRFEPCGLPQMIAPIYGSLPVVRDTGGLHDTITHMDVNKNTGNGFIFTHYDSNALSWGIDEAMRFYNLPNDTKKHQINRIMQESAKTFSHSVTAKNYIELYEKMLNRPLIN